MRRRTVDIDTAEDHALEGRKRMVDRGGPTVFEVEGDQVNFAGCYTFAELGNLPANVMDYIYKTLDGRFLRETIGTDSDKSGDVLTGGERWYVARMVAETERQGGG